MQPLPEIISKISSGVLHLVFLRDRERIGSGSPFMVHGYVVTNSHVIRDAPYDTVAIRTINSETDDLGDAIRLSRDAFLGQVVTEEPKNLADYAVLNITEPELKGLWNFDLGSEADVRVGEQVLFLGYPFELTHLAAHIGYVSSKHHRGQVRVMQIDGSVNAGNSGGPLLDPKSLRVAGIVTRSSTGLDRQFDALIKAFRHNQQILDASKGMINLGGVDLLDALKKSQAALERRAFNIKRSANVGIGYAFSADHVAASPPLARTS